MNFYRIYSIIKRSDVSPALMIMNKVLPMFKKKPQRPKYDKTNKKAVLKCSICTGEQVAGFKDIHTGKIEDIMLIKTSADIEKFKEMYGIEGNIDKEY